MRVNIQRVGKQASGDRASAIVLNRISRRVAASKKAARAVEMAALPASASAPTVPDGAPDGGMHAWCDERREKP